MAAGTVVCGSMVVMQLLLLRIDIKGRKTNVRNSRDGRLQGSSPMVWSPGGSGLWEGAPVRGLLLLLASACNGWMESVSPVGPGARPHQPS